MTWDTETQLHIMRAAPAGAPLIGCMGGNCAQELRTICAHYARSNARNLSERMCIAGRADEFERIGGAAQAIAEGAA